MSLKLKASHKPKSVLVARYSVESKQGATMRVVKLHLSETGTKLLTSTSNGIGKSGRELTHSDVPDRREKSAA